MKHVLFAAFAAATLALQSPVTAYADESIPSQMDSPDHRSEYETSITQFYQAQLANSKLAWVKSRQKIITRAQDDCGGRYIGTKTQVVRLESSYYSDNTGAATGTNSYTVNSTDTFLVIETIECSVHHGYDQSTLNSVLVNATEAIDFVYNDDQTGSLQSVSPARRTFKLGKAQLNAFPKAPYDVEGN